jgi:hypothetical protein
MDAASEDDCRAQILAIVKQNPGFFRRQEGIPDAARKVRCRQPVVFLPARRL